MVSADQCVLCSLQDDCPASSPVGERPETPVPEPADFVVVEAEEAPKVTGVPEAVSGSAHVLDVAGPSSECAANETECSSALDKAVQCDMRDGYIDFAKLKQGDRDIKSLTGFEDIETFQMLLYILQPAYRKAHMSKRFATSSLGFENDVLLTVTKLRNDLSNSFLGTMFDISTSHVSRVFKKMILLMDEVFRQVELWPSKYEQDKPVVIVDCTEVRIQRPADPTLQSKTYSTYKSGNTVKILLGITMEGGISFVSDAFSGSSSDQKVFSKSGIMDKLKSGDIVMADRGFNVQDMLATRDIRVVTPAFLKGRSQLSSAEVAISRAITKDRIHVERVIGLTKTYQLLKGTINSSYVQYVSELYYVAAFLCGLRPAIL